MKHYIYFHRRNDTNEVFYVGKGSGNRAYQGSSSRRNAHWKNIVNKAGLTVEIVAEYEDKELAFAAETKYIIACMWQNYKLINLSFGGNGGRGREPWNKGLTGIKTRPTGLAPWNKGIKTGIAPGNKGKPMSEEQKEFLREFWKGKKFGSKDK